MSARIDRARGALEDAAVRFAMGAADTAELERAARAFFDAVSDDDTGDLPTVPELRAARPRSLSQVA